MNLTLDLTMKTVLIIPVKYCSTVTIVISVA